MITIGRQAKQYWVSYHSELYRNALPDARLVTSVNLYCSALRHEVAAIAAALGEDPNMNEQGQPPSLARFELVDVDTEQIKKVDGRFFADPDAPAHPHTVDVIDFPSGFNYVDFSGDSQILNHERFMVEQDMAKCPESPTTPVVHALQTESSSSVSEECLPWAWASFTTNAVA